MNILFFLIPLSLLFSLLGLAAFIWGVKSGQFDDLESPALELTYEERIYNRASKTISKGGERDDI
ncbi:MAG: cbb3-type cytochrome oxidase assembly protein CcoS [Oligoflexales bacterium]|nr:cbb3-type cytochrome oxidase assembly protein CcoS [Oligoflexales bacterium]